MQKHKFTGWFLSFLFLTFTQFQCVAQEMKNDTINISRTGGAAVTIDGKIEEKEWRDSLAYDLSGGGKVYLKHDGEYLYIGVRGIKAGWSQLYLSEGEENTLVYVFHASAALGMSVYSQDENKAWQPSNSFSWELRDRTITPEIRKKMADYLSKNYWVANNNNMNNPSEIEFQLKPRTPSNKQYRIAIEYVTGDERQFFPASLADDSLKSQLASGYTPRDLNFNQTQWAKIKLK